MLCETERYELSDVVWTAIKLRVPNKPRGVPLVYDRHRLNEFLRCVERGIE